jgi:periplasmic divalent cation tolerance protein
VKKSSGDKAAMMEIVILSTVDSMETASKIARALVEGKEAACVNIVPGIRSIYRWEGKVCDDSELLLIIKTTEARFEAVRRRIRALHPYQLPESIAIPIIAGDQEYLAWLSSNVAGMPSDDPPL